MGSKRSKDKTKKVEKPSFDEATLAQLTRKLDKALPDPAKQSSTKRKRRADSDDGPDSKRRQTRSTGTNRQKEGHGEGRKKKQPSLLDEILALGGDEADLELVADVDSGNEDGNEPKHKPKASATELHVDESLKNELAQFASSLGFHKLREEQQDPATDDSDNDAEDADDAHGSEPEDSSEEEEESGEQENVEDVPQPQEARKGKQSEKLVSKHSCRAAGLTC